MANVCFFEYLTMLIANDFHCRIIAKLLLLLVSGRKECNVSVLFDSMIYKNRQFNAARILKYRWS